MSDKQQSAVEWLIEELTKNGFIFLNYQEEINQAKELFKKQIIDARTPIISFLNQIEQQELRNESEKYFNETFKTERNGK